MTTRTVDMSRQGLAAWLREEAANARVNGVEDWPLAMRISVAKWDAIAAYLDPPPEMRERQVEAVLRTTAERQSPLVHGEAVSALRAADEVTP